MNTLNQLPPGTQAALDLINDFDQCFLTGFANLEYPQQQSLSIWQQVFAETPLQQPLSDSCKAIQANEFLERYFAILAVVRAAMQGMLFDTLQQQVSTLLGRTQSEQITIADQSGELPAHLSVWLESVRHWLMEIALVGYTRLESATLVPFLATLEQIQGEPLLIRQSALLTGFFNELIGLVPVADTNTIPLYRWVDLWSQAMIVSLQPIPLPQPQIVSGNLEILGMDLRHHANLVSFTIYGLLSYDAEIRLVKITQSTYKVDVISHEQIWLLFPDSTSLLEAYSKNQVLHLDDIPLLPTGDLIWQDQKAKMGKKYDLMARAAEFFGENPHHSFIPCLIPPSDRHPIQLAEPIFLDNYKIVPQDDQLVLSWKDGDSLAIATQRISPLSEITQEVLTNSSQIFGLLRFDAGYWAIQPLTVTVKGKAIFTGQNAAKIRKSPPKTNVVGILQERASRLLRKS